jgi:hypothetical protein
MEYCIYENNEVTNKLLNDIHLAFQFPYLKWRLFCTINCFKTTLCMIRKRLSSKHKFNIRAFVKIFNLKSAKCRVPAVKRCSVLHCSVVIFFSGLSGSLTTLHCLSRILSFAQSGAKGMLNNPNTRIINNSE